MKLIRNGTLVYPDKSRTADLLIDGEKIAKIADRIEAPQGCEIIDASGKLVFPGFIDAHTHFDLHVAGKEVDIVNLCLRSAADIGNADINLGILDLIIL